MSHSRNLNQDEYDFLLAKRLVIREHWISPEEGWEFALLPMGADHRHTICIRKSARAAYNQARRYLKTLNA